jgi:hypothetical protein
LQSENRSPPGTPAGLNDQVPIMYWIFDIASVVNSPALGRSGGILLEKLAPTHSALEASIEATHLRIAAIAPVGGVGGVGVQVRSAVRVYPAPPLVKQLRALDPV